MPIGPGHGEDLGRGSRKAKTDVAVSGTLGGEAISGTGRMAVQSGGGRQLCCLEAPCLLGVTGSVGYSPL